MNLPTLAEGHRLAEARLALLDQRKGQVQIQAQRWAAQPSLGAAQQLLAAKAALDKATQQASLAASGVKSLELATLLRLMPWMVVEAEAAEDMARSLFSADALANQVLTALDLPGLDPGPENLAGLSWRRRGLGGVADAAFDSLDALGEYSARNSGEIQANLFSLSGFALTPPLKPLVKVWGKLPALVYDSTGSPLLTAGTVYLSAGSAAGAAIFPLVVGYQALKGFHEATGRNSALTLTAAAAAAPLYGAAIPYLAAAGSAGAGAAVAAGGAALDLGAAAIVLAAPIAVPAAAAYGLYLGAKALFFSDDEPGESPVERQQRLAAQKRRSEAEVKQLIAGDQAESERWFRAELEVAQDQGGSMASDEGWYAAAGLLVVGGVLLVLV